MQPLKPRVQGMAAALRGFHHEVLSVGLTITVEERDTDI